MTETIQRVGRYLYRKVRVRVTNPAHLVPSAGTGNTDKLGLDSRYEAGKVKRVTDRTPYRKDEDASA
jgi:hypothetical protein